MNPTEYWNGVAAPYEIERSLRFNDGDDAFLVRTPGSASSRTTWTWSAWVKRSTLGVEQTLFSAAPSTHASSSALTYLDFNANDELVFFSYWSSAVRNRIDTNARFRDVSAWYHIVLSVDTTNGTADDRQKIYINGVEQTVKNRTNPTPSLGLYVNAAVEHKLGEEAVRDRYNFDGYLAEVNFIDGTALDHTSFGETDTKTGAWIPKKYTGSYGTNGFYLSFSDNSSVSALGTDASGNGNNWTPNNLSVTAGAGNDSLEDTPTNNWCTWNSLSAANNTDITFAEGNLKLTSTVDSWPMRSGTFGVSTGKWYYETKALDITRFGVGWGEDASLGTTTFSVSNANSYLFWSNNPAQKYEKGTNVSINGSPALANNDIIGIAIDFDAGKIWYSINNTWLNDDSGNVGDPAGGNNPQSTFTANTPMLPNAMLNLASFISNFGQRPFDYTPPTGFKALNTANLPVPTIKDGSDYFTPVLYTGNATARNITVADSQDNSWQPDFVWIKQRSTSRSHKLFDSIRGVTKVMECDNTGAEGTDSGSLTAFNSDGFSLGTSAGQNNSGSTYVAWNWKESVDAGFDIVADTGTGAAKTVSHNLGVAPKMIIRKSRTSSTGHWYVYHYEEGASKAGILQLTNSFAASTAWNSTAPTSSVFSVGANVDENKLNDNYISYLFAEVEGYSKFGSYTGNGSSNGPFVSCGFRPAMIWTKRADGTSNWYEFDDKRNPFNLTDNRIELNSNAAEFDGYNNNHDLLSNGFKLRSSDAGSNGSGGTYIFAAWAVNPFKYSNAR